MPLAHSGGKDAKPMTRLKSPRKGALTTRERLLSFEDEQSRRFVKEHGLQEFGDARGIGKWLPRGWEETKDEYGRSFFSHKESSHSCWARPIVAQLPWKYRCVAKTMSHLLSRPQESEWVRITLESDEDRVKLFSALYHLCIEEVTKEHFAKGVEEPIPTLAECHKRARKDKIKVSQYSNFLERVLRNKSFRKEEPKSKIPKPKIPRPQSPRERKALIKKAFTPRGRLLEPEGKFYSEQKACRTCRSMSPRPRKGKSSSFHFSTSTGHRPDERGMSFAEFGSLQAKKFRERKVQEIKVAKEVKNELEAHFWEGKRNVFQNKTLRKTELPSILLVATNKAQEKPSEEQEEIAPDAKKMNQIELAETMAQIERVKSELMTRNADSEGSRVKKLRNQFEDEVKEANSNDEESKLQLKELNRQCKSLETELAAAKMSNGRTFDADAVDVRIEDLSIRLSDKEGEVRDFHQKLLESEADREALNLYLKELEKMNDESEREQRELHKEVKRVRQDMAESLDAKTLEIRKLKKKFTEESQQLRSKMERALMEKLDEQKKKHAENVSKALMKAKDHFQKNIDEQRNKFLLQVTALEDQYTEQLNVQEAGHAKEIQSLEKRHGSDLKVIKDQASKEMAKRLEKEVTELQTQHKQDLIAACKLAAARYLRSQARRAKYRLTCVAFAHWRQVLERERADELVDVYGAAMDRNSGAARIAILLNKFLIRSIKNCISTWRIYVAYGPALDVLRPHLYQVDALYPSEVMRRLRRKVNDRVFAGEVNDFYDSLEIDRNGKIPPQAFHRGLLRRKAELRNKTIPRLRNEFNERLISSFAGKPIQEGRQEAVQPSKDWSMMAAACLTRLDSVVKKWAFISKLQAFRRLGISRQAPRRKISMSQQEFMRKMEIEALQEEVRALHIQLGASKAEVWKYKRRLLLS